MISIDKPSVDKIVSDREFQHKMLLAELTLGENSEQSAIDDTAADINEYIANMFSIASGHIKTEIILNPFCIRLNTDYKFSDETIHRANIDIIKVDNETITWVANRA